MTEQLELVISRHFDAPRELLFQAFTDPEQLAAWFGPIGWSVPRETVSIDATTGGHQRFIMEADDGSMSSPINATFTEVVDGHLLVGHEDVVGIPGFEGTAHFTLSLEFFDEEGGSRLELRQGPYTTEMEGNAREGWMQSFVKLDALLTTC